LAFDLRARWSSSLIFSDVTVLKLDRQSARFFTRFGQMLNRRMAPSTRECRLIDVRRLHATAIRDFPREPSREHEASIAQQHATSLQVSGEHRITLGQSSFIEKQFA
jgi:hypothetical protein